MHRQAPGFFQSDPSGSYILPRCALGKLMHKICDHGENLWKVNGESTKEE